MGVAVSVLAATVATVSSGSSGAAASIGAREAAPPDETATPTAEPSRGPARDLVLALVSGEPFRQRMTVDQRQSQEPPAQGRLETTSKVTLDLTHQVLAGPATEGRFVLRVTIDRVRAEVGTSLMAPVRLDTADPGTLVDNPLTAAFGSLLAVLERPLQYELTESGRFVADDQISAVAMGQGGGTITPLRAFLSQMLVASPGRPVAVSDRWTQTIPGRDIGLDHDPELVWTLAGVVGDAVRLEVSGGREVAGQPVTLSPGVTGTMSMSRRMSGTATVRADGWISELETIQTSEGAASASTGGTPIRVPFSSTVKTRIESIE